MSRFIELRRCDFGVEPICRTLGVSASAYYERRSGKQSKRAVDDARLLEVIKTVHEQNYFAYGYRRMWIALKRSGEHVARCRVQRLMKTNGIQGAKRRGKPGKSWNSCVPGCAPWASIRMRDRGAHHSPLSFPP